MGFNIERAITDINPDTIMMIGNFKIANSTLFGVFILLLLVVFCLVVVRKFKERPGNTQTGVELLYEGMADFIDQITGNRKRTEVILPAIATMFVYFGISNLIGLIPGLTSITIGDMPLFRTPTADFNTTFAVAFASILILQYIGAREWGFFGQIGKYFRFKDVYLGFRKSISDGFMAIIDFLIGLLDIIGEIAKIVSLSLRLFGNIYAGEVLAIIILGGFAYVVPSIWIGMNILTGAIQAIVFGALIAAYYSLTINPEKDPK